MEPSRQTLLTSGLDAQPHPSDKEIYLKPLSLRHQERPKNAREPGKENLCE